MAGPELTVTDDHEGLLPWSSPQGPENGDKDPGAMRNTAEHR